MAPKLSADQLNRALGAIWGLAAGETLVSLPGGWGEGTALGIPVLEQLGAGLDLSAPDAQGRTVRRWIEWVLSIPDPYVPVDTTAKPDAPSLAQKVLSRLARHDWEDQADDTVAVACTQTARTTPNDGTAPPDCGALLRSTVLALGFLTDAPDSPALANAAIAIAALTDASAEAAEASIMWAAMIRSAIVSGKPDLHAGLRFLEPQRASKWLALIQGLPPKLNRKDIAAAVPETHSCISNLVAAYLAFTHSEFNTSFKTTMDEVLDRRGTYFTQPTIGLTGALAGAVLGAQAVPADFKKSAHGWPAIHGDALERLVSEAIEAAETGLLTRAAHANAHGHNAAVPGYVDIPGYGAPPPPMGDAPAYFSPTGAPAYDAPPPMPPSYDAPPPLYQ